MSKELSEQTKREMEHGAMHIKWAACKERLGDRLQEKFDWGTKVYTLQIMSADRKQYLRIVDPLGYAGPDTIAKVLLVE